MRSYREDRLRGPWFFTQAVLFHPQIIDPAGLYLWNNPSQPFPLSDLFVKLEDSNALWVCVCTRVHLQISEMNISNTPGNSRAPSWWMLPSRGNYCWPLSAYSYVSLNFTYVESYSLRSVVSGFSCSSICMLDCSISLLVVMVSF